jgi:hypothetical protein
MEDNDQLHPPGRSPWYPLDRRLGGSQSQSGCSGKEKNSQPLPELEPLMVTGKYCTNLRLCQMPVSQMKASYLVKILFGYHGQASANVGLFTSPIKLSLQVHSLENKIYV